MVKLTISNSKTRFGEVLNKRVHSVCAFILRRVKVFEVDHFPQNTHGKEKLLTHKQTHRSYMSSSLCRRWQRAGRCRSCPAWCGPSSCGTGCREGRRTWWRQTHPWSPFYTERQQDRFGKSQLIAGDGGDTPAASQPAIKLTLILWILGPRFSFFAGTSTHTCMPFPSNLFAQLSVDKHCLLKSAKTASSGKILDIFKSFPQK